MLILHDGNPLKRIRRPWVNQALIVTAIAVFILQFTHAIAWRRWAFFPSQLWHLAPGPGPLYGVAGLVTHQFLHGSPLHLIANLVALRVFGDNIEDALGHWRYALFYLGGGVAAALTQALLGGPNPMIGASGAISAVMGGYLLLHPRARMLILAFNIAPVLAPASLVVAFNIAVNIAMAYDVSLLTGHAPDPADAAIAWWAHIGGFGCGLALVPMLKASSVPLFQAPPPAPERSMRLLGRLIPSLSWPGDRPFSEDTAAAVAAVEHPTRAKLMVFAKAGLYVLLLLVLMRFLRS